MFDEMMNQQAVIDSRKQRESENPLYRAIGEISAGKSFEKFTSDKKKQFQTSIWNSPAKLARLLKTQENSPEGPNMIIEPVTN